MTKAARVLVIDGTRIYRRILQDVFSQSADLQLVGVLESGEAAIALAAEEQVDVVVWDAQLAELDEFRGLKSFAEKYPAVPVLATAMPTVHGCRSMERAVQRGAVDSIPKPATIGHLDRVLKDLQSRLVPRVEYWARRDRDHSPLLAQREPA